MVHKGRSSRVGLLAVNEAEIIKRADNRENLVKERALLLEKENMTRKDAERLRAINKELKQISTRLSELVENLHERIIAAEEDLQVILKSESLRPLVVVTNRHLIHFPFPHEGDYDKYGLWQSLDGLYQLKFQEYDPYEPIPNYSRWKVKYETDPKYGTKHYWLDTEIEPVPTIEDIFNPEYSIKGIKGTWNNKIKVSDKKGKVRIKTEKIDIREILKTALNLEKRFQNRIRSENLPQIFPRTRDKAIKWKEMLDKIDHFEQVRREIGSDVIISSSPVNENDQARKRFERYMEKGKAEMVRAYTAAERHLNEAQKIYKKYGLHLQYSQKSLKDY